MKTTFDYVMLDVCTASLLETCETLEEDDLTVSDHLPQSVTLKMVCEHPSIVSSDQKAVIDWVKPVSSVDIINAYKLAESVLCGFPILY